MPSLFEPYVRMGLLHWNPLEGDGGRGGGDGGASGQGGGALQGFNAVLASTITDAEVGRGGLGVAAEAGKLVHAALVVACVVPRLTWHVADVWDPMGRGAQTRALMGAIQDAHRHVQLLSRHADWAKGTALGTYVGLVDAAMARLDRAATDVAIPLLRSQREPAALMPPAALHNLLDQAVVDEPFQRALRLARSVVRCMAVIDGGSVVGARQRQRAESLLLGRLAGCIRRCTRASPEHCTRVCQHADVFCSMQKEASAGGTGAAAWTAFVKAAGLFCES